MQSSISIAIIICTRDRPVLLEQCLDSISRLDDQPTRVIVVDSASKTDETKLIVSKFNCTYLRNDQPGHSKARNRGASACTEDIIAYVDDDMVLPKTWLSIILEELSDETVTGVTGPFVPLNLSSASPTDLRRYLSTAPWGPTQFRVDRHSDDWFERTCFGGLGDGNFAIRRCVFNDWQGFDERLGRGMPLDVGDDHFAFFELVNKGHAFRYVPCAMVFHPQREKTRQQRMHDLAQSMAFSAYIALRYPRRAFDIIKFAHRFMSGETPSWRTWTDHESPIMHRKNDVLSVLLKSLAILLRTWVFRPS